MSANTVAEILSQMAENASRRQMYRGAVIGNTISQASQVPAQYVEDRRRQAVIDLEQAQRAQQLKYAGNADARAQQDQEMQVAGNAAELEQRKVLALGVAAGFGESQDPKDFDLPRAVQVITAAGHPELATKLTEFHEKLLPKLTSGAQGSFMRGPDGKVIEGSGIPEKKSDYTISGQRFSGDGTPIGPLVPAQVPAETHSPIYKEWQDYKKEGGLLGLEAYMNADANRKKPTVNVSGLSGLYNDIDPKAIAAQIRLAAHPPDISQYGRPAAAAIASELAKKGPNGEPPFNLSAAQREWAAQKRLNATMNGGQQVRLDESIRSGLAMYDKVDELASQWDGLGIGPLSRVNLAAAKEGLKGKAAASLANQLSGQIGQLTSDIATIEQGGLTPTNEARAVAEKSMQDWWGKGTIKDMTAQGRYNMQIRHTARNTQDVMVPGNGVDTRPAQPATPQASGLTYKLVDGKWVKQ